MPLRNNVVVAGMSAPAAAASIGIAATSLAVAGASQTTAAVIPADVSKFTSGTGGCILPTMNGGDNIVVVNSTGSAINLYPPVGGFINALTQNTAYSIASATPYCQITCVDPTHYHCFQSA